MLNRWDRTAVTKKKKRDEKKEKKKISFPLRESNPGRLGESQES